MEKLFNLTSIAAGLCGGAAVRLLGGWDAMIYTLVVVMALDYITGVIKGVYFKQLSSAVGFRGILKKLLIIIMVALANTLQEVLGIDAALRETVIMFYVANEAISILENTAEIMPNMPSGLKQILMNIRTE